jgi:hypothetical protein
MRFLLSASISHEAGNRLAKQGKLASTVQAVLESIKPEAAYFGSKDGKRTAFLIVDLPDASRIPAVAEPLFLALGADIDFIPVMVKEDLMKAAPDIEAAVKKFGS